MSLVRYRITIFTSTSVPTRDSREKFAYLWCESDRVYIHDLTSNRTDEGTEFAFKCGRDERDHSKYTHGFILYDERGAIVFESPLNMTPGEGRYIHSFDGNMLFLDQHGVKRYIVPYIDPNKCYCLLYLDDPYNDFFRRAHRDQNTGNSLILQKIQDHCVLSLNHGMSTDSNVLRVLNFRGEIVAKSSSAEYIITLGSTGINVQKNGDTAIFGRRFGIYRNSSGGSYFELRERGHKDGHADRTRAFETKAESAFDRLEGSITVRARFGDLANPQIVEYILIPVCNDETWFFATYDPTRKEVLGFTSFHNEGNLVHASFRQLLKQDQRDYDYGLLGLYWHRQYPTSYVVETFK